jgi:hypothetical protein
MKKVAIHTRVPMDEQATENQLAMPTDWATQAGFEREFDERLTSLTDPAEPRHAGHQQAGRRRYGDRSSSREEASAKNQRCSPVMKTLGNIRTLVVVCAAGAILVLFWLTLVLRKEFNDEKDPFLSND